jgi:flagellin
MERLSSGMRINRAGDDAAGLAISEKMRGQIRGLKQAARNAQDGISLIQTAEGALNETHAILQRMRELATQSATDTNTEVDRTEIQKEIDQLAQEITRIANNTEFNTQTLMNGGITNTKFHIGANTGQDITVAIKAMDAFALGVARDSLEASLADGATNIDNVQVDGTIGAGIVDGATITVSAAENTGTVATGTAVIGAQTGVLSATVNNAGTEYNGYTIEFKQGTQAAAAVVNGTTITVTADFTNSEGEGDGSLVPDLSAIENAINTALGAGGGISLNVDGSFTATEFVDKSVVLDGGAAANPDETIVTLTDTANSKTQTVVVGNDVTSVSVTNGDFAGLSFDTTGVRTAAGTITIRLDVAAKATFNPDGTLKDEAVAPKGIDVSSQSNASQAIKTIDTAIGLVSAERSMLGAVQNRLEHTIANLGTSAENLQAAESRIRDLDMAEEIMAFTKNNILQQAATAMLAQANMAPQSVLQLLG